MLAALGIEAYLVRVLVGHLDELLIKGWEGIIGTIATSIAITIVTITTSSRLLSI